VLFSLHGARVVAAATPDEGLTAMADGGIDLVIQDMNFRREATGGDEGVALFHNIRRSFPDVRSILLTAWTHLETAVELVKAGAADYISKPWDDARLLTSVRNLLDFAQCPRRSAEIRAERREARDALAERFDLCGIVYESQTMHTLVAMATQVAHADVPVLITGPNGAGKEVLADIVHANSAARGQSGWPRGWPPPVSQVNLGALPNDLIEAELFGTEAGAFTGARRPHRAIRSRRWRHGCSSMRSATLPAAARQSSCESCRPASSSVWAPTPRGGPRACHRGDERESAPGHP